MEVLVPDGYRKIVVRENQSGFSLCDVYFNPDTKKYFIRTGDRLAGPMDKLQLVAIKDAINDVLWLKGNYLFLEDQ
jgi:hypothetical protein